MEEFTKDICMEDFLVGMGILCEGTRTQNRTRKMRKSTKTSKKKQNKINGDQKSVFRNIVLNFVL